MVVVVVWLQDLSVQDGTGVPHLPGYDLSQWSSDLKTPTATLCSTYSAWGSMLNAAKSLGVALEPFRYDLVNVGREVLAQLSTPRSVAYSNAFSAGTLVPATLNATAEAYINLLEDIDTLVGTDSAFLIGPWLESAKAWGANATDCGDKSCTAFYEWNARTQLTTWNPTPANAPVIPSGPIDYASKHWNGLISDYYAARAKLVWRQALTDAAAGQPLDKTVMSRLEAQLAYQWTNANNLYPNTPVGDAFAVSVDMHAKYSSHFASCT